MPLRALAGRPLIWPPADNPLRIELEAVAAAQKVTPEVVVEIEGIRLITDLVVAGIGIAILPETAIPPTLTGARAFTIARMPPRRLALVTARDAHLSLADRAVRESLLRVVATRRH